MTAIGASTASWLGSAYDSINSSSGDWISNTAGASLDSAGSISSFLSKSASFSNLLANATQTQASSLNDIYARRALLRIQEENLKALDQANKEYAETQSDLANKVQDPVTTDSSMTIDFTTNLMTMRDGTMIDITSGLKVNPITHLPYAPTYVTKA